MNLLTGATHGRNLNVNIFDMLYTSNAPGSPDALEGLLAQEAYALYDAFLGFLMTGKGDLVCSTDRGAYQFGTDCGIDLR